MSARNPSDFTTYPDDLDMVQRSKVLSSVIGEVINQQIYVLDAERMILSDFFPAISVDSASLTEIGHWYVCPKNMCGDPDFTGTYNWKWSGYLWAAGTVTSFEAKLSNVTAGTSTTQTINATITTESWRAFQNIASGYTHADQELKLEVRRAGGTGAVYCAGLGVFAPET